MAPKLSAANESERLGKMDKVNAVNTQNEHEQKTREIWPSIKNRCQCTLEERITQARERARGIGESRGTRLVG